MALRKEAVADAKKYSDEAIQKAFKKKMGKDGGSPDIGVAKKKKKGKSGREGSAERTQGASAQNTGNAGDLSADASAVSQSAAFLALEKTNE